MGRKSLAEQRTSQIIDAFETCIVEHGLDNATLQQTAASAEVNIGMIHHYIGNRDDLLRAMAERLSQKARAEMAGFVQLVPAKMRMPHLLKSFFDNNDAHADKVINALVSASGHNPLARQLSFEINQVYEEILAEEINHLHPHLPSGRCREVAFSVLALAYGSGLLVELGFDEQGNQHALRAAEALLASLGNT